jgi:hypothetical protein
MSKSVLQYRRIWAMPNKNTFSIKPIKRFIQKHTIAGKSLDPFPFPFRKDALELLKETPSNSIHLLFYDPVYSRRQRHEIYKIKGTDYKTHPEYFNDVETEIFRVMVNRGRVLKFGWNSKPLPGFEAIDGIIVPHGGQHNDTICTAFEKVQGVLN